MTWQGMLSSSIGLLIATPGHFLEDQIGVIPISQYMFNPMNIIITIALLVLPPIFAGMLHPKEEHVSPLEKTAIEMIELESEAVDEMPENPSVGDRLNHSRILAYALALMGVVYIVYTSRPRALTSISTWSTPSSSSPASSCTATSRTYIRAVKNGIGGVSGIVFQFPLYAGIMGMIKYSGLVDILATGHRLDQHALHLPAVDLHQRLDRQPVRPLPRRPVGGSGPDRGPVGDDDERRYHQDRAGGRLRQHLDQHVPAVLGDRGCSASPA